MIRRAVRHAKQLGLAPGFSRAVADTIIAGYQAAYPELRHNRENILRELAGEEEKFEKTLGQGMQELDKALEQLNAHGQKILWKL